MNKFNGTVDQIENNSYKKAEIDASTALNSENYPTVKAVQDYVDAGSSAVVRKTGNSSIDNNDQIKVKNGISIFSDGSVATLDDSIIPYPGTISGNVITFTPPTGYKANGIFSIKISGDSNVAGTMTAKVSISTASFTVCAYAGGKEISNFPAGAINVDIPMLCTVKTVGRKLIWINYNPESGTAETTLPDVLAIGRHYKISATEKIILKLPDTANDGDRIDVEYYNAGTASITAQWCTETSTISNLPILATTAMGTGGNTSVAKGSYQKGICVYNGLANTWLVELVSFSVRSK